MSTKQKIIEAGEKLIRTQGFNAFSYKDIAFPLHIKNAAVHYHFPVKANLGMMVIEYNMHKFQQNTLAWQWLPEDEQLRLFTKIYEQCSESEQICLMGSLAPDFLTLSVSMQAKLIEMGEWVSHWLTACLDHGRKSGVFHFQGQAQDKALLVISNLMGALLLARVFGKKTFQTMSQQMMLELGSSYLPNQQNNKERK